MSFSKIVLTEPQQRLLLRLAYGGGIGLVDGRDQRPLEALICGNLAVRHGSVAARLTAAGELEAARRWTGG
jgi:hypothetical protein